MLYLMEVMQFFLGLRHRGLRPVETVSTVSRICAENWGSINLVIASEKSLACSSATKVVVLTWLELSKTSVSLHLNIFWTTLMWIIAIVSLPGRFLAALRRERKELQKQFQAALKEHKMMELMLDELEMIHEEATNKIALLESEDCSLKTDQKHGVVE
ncbi:uncharacterized protein LOC103488382 [Cucumis melo]|uniref:Uncharacterized protein LOC103488382 n=1 Tax=Cucumis melo TaxID=3656 RepID=A0ABM3KFA9_CUCME|nr:uncharacterized protein LOC103488382 [Cucumis melo]XP_050936455.1 uncharacterized protein LOC103488382 [Cucumis melo]